MWSGQLGSVCTSSRPWEAAGIWPEWDNFATQFISPLLQEAITDPILTLLRQRGFNLFQGQPTPSRQDLFIKLSVVLGHLPHKTAREEDHDKFLKILELIFLKTQILCSDRR